MAYTAFGDVPHYLKRFDYCLPLAENIKRSIF